MTAAAIEVQHASLTVREHFWSRPRTLVEDLSFVVPQGTLCGFVGANGAGKTTTLQLLLGHIAPTSGSLRLFGVPVDDPRARVGLGYLPEQAPPGRALTPQRLVRAHALLRGVPPNQATRAAQEALERVQLIGHSHRCMRTFSKGMRQRVSLAQALAGAPRLLILDEPLSGLDPPGRHLVRELLAELTASGCTVFFSTHMLSDVSLLCHQVVVLHHGRLTYSGAPAALEARAGHGRMEVVGQGVDAASCAVAETLGAAVSHFGPRHRFVLPDVTAANTLAAQLLRQGAVVHSLSPYGGSALEAWVTDQEGHTP